MLYRLLKNLRSKKSAQSKKRSPQKSKKFWQSPAWKIGIGLSAVVLLITVVLFNKQIDNLLRLWGIKANQMGEVTLSVAPSTADVYPKEIPLPPRTAEYDITIDPQQADMWLIPPETEGLTSINITKVTLFRFNLLADQYIDSLTLKKEDGTSFVYDFANSWFDLSGSPIVFSNTDLDPDKPQILHLTFITSVDPTDLPLESDLRALFDVGVEGKWYDIKIGGELGMAEVSYLPPPPFELMFRAGQPPLIPDFSLQITSPADKGQSEIITAGNDANYTITVTAINGFRGPVNLQHVGFTDYMPPLGDAITSIDFPTEVDINDDTPHDVALVVHTNVALGAPVDINFRVVGIDIAGNIRSDSGILHITPALPAAPDFRITATPLASVSRDELLRYVTYPGGQVQYNITVLRENWSGVVEADVVWLDGVAAARDIERVEFDNGGHFTIGSTSESALLTIYTKTTATPEDLTFYVQGLGDLDGTPPLEERITIELTFSIMDFSIALSPLNQTVGDGETADYQVQLTSYNQFNGTIRFSVIPNSPTDYQNYIAAEQFNFPDYPWHADDPSPIISLSIDTKAYDPDNPLPYPKDILFRVRAAVLLPFTGLEHDSNETTLTITLNPDFTISFKSLSPIVEELNRDIITYPGGQATFGVVVDRLNGFTGNVRAEVVWMDPIDAALAIDQVIFDNGGNFTGGTTLEETTATVITKTTAPTKDYDFYINGYGDINGDTIEEIRRTRVLTLGIVDFMIVIYGPTTNDPPNVTVSAGDTAYYSLEIRGSNFFNGTIDLSIDPDLAAIYPQHVAKNPNFTISLKMTTAYQSIIISFDIQTQSTSPGTEPGGLLFRIKGVCANRFPVPLERWSNEGTLHIEGLEPGFSLTLEYKNSTSDTVLGTTHTAVPYGSITYTVRLIRNNWSGAVTVNADKLLADYPNAIDSASFANGGHFTGTGVETTDLTINIKSTSLPIDISFAISGTDDGGVLPVVTSNIALFSIIDYTITLVPPINSIDEGTAGERIYTVIATPQNGYMGFIDLTTDLITGNGIENITFDNDPARRLDCSLGNPASTVMHIFTNTNIAPPDRNFTVTGTDPNKTTIDNANFFNQGAGTLRVVGAPPPPPSFTIAIAPPSREIGPPDWRTSYNVTITPQGGFRGTVDLTYKFTTPLPPQIKITLAADVTFTDANPDPQTIPLDIKATSPIPNTTLYFVVNGRSYDYGDDPISAQSNQATLVINNDQPNFEIYITPPRNIPPVNPGGTANYTVSISRRNNFTGDVTLATNAGSLAGISAYSFDDSILNTGENSTVLHLTAADPYIDAVILFQVSGDGGTPGPGIKTVSAEFAIKNPLIPSFSILVDPDSRLVAPDGKTTYNVTVTPSGGFVGQVDLTETLSSHLSINSAVFKDAYLVFDGTEINRSTVLDVSVKPSVPDESIPFYVNGRSDDYGAPIFAQSNLARLNITNTQDFTLSLEPINDTVLPGQTANYTLRLTRLNGFTGNVTAFITTDQPGLIANITIENNGIFDATTGDDLFVNITTMANAIAQDILITAHGTAAGIVGERTDDAILHIVDFVIDVTPRYLQGRRGNIVTYLVKLVRNNNFDRAINLSTSLTGNINLSDVSFANGGVFPAQVGGDQQTNLNVAIAPDARAMDIPFIVTGTDLTSAQQREDSAILSIYEVIPLANFTITISPPDGQTVEPGGSTAYTITITRYNYHTEDITLTTDLATGNSNEIESAEFADTVISVGEDSTTLNVKTKATARSSTDPITFTVFGIATGGLTRSDDADLIIYKATDDGGGGGGGGTVTPPVVPPVIIPPVIEPPIALPSTGPDWLWLISGALMLIGYQLKRNRQ